MRGEQKIDQRSTLNGSVRRPFSGVLPLAWALTAALVLSTGAREGSAQREPEVRTGGESVFLDVDSVAAKKLGAARDLMTARQWSDAIDLVRQVGEQHAGRLVGIEPGRYVAVQTYCDILLSSLPPEGLVIYRARLDPQAKRWFESARSGADEEGLQKVIRQAFLSSYGDDALLLLGELAWERGAISAARSVWEKLLPLAQKREPGELSAVLRYPDADIDPAEVRARLVLCSYAQGNVGRARQELAIFGELHPQAEGTLAGKTGRLAELVAGLMRSPVRPPASVETSPSPTFAANPQRNARTSDTIDVGAVQWSVPLTPMRIERVSRRDDTRFDDPFNPPDRSAATQPMDVLSAYPVVHHEIVFVCDETSIYAYKLTAQNPLGEAAWPANGKPPQTAEEVKASARIFSLPPALEPSKILVRQRAGLPRFTLTVHDGKLYARMGTTAATHAPNRGLNTSPSLLVCLDLAREGDLKWIWNGAEIPTDGGPWTFDGSPVIAEGRVYVALRRMSPQPQLNVACFDTNTQKLLWNRKICVGLDAFAGDVDEIHHQLLTLADDRLFYSTNLGAIASIEASGGSLQWIATYPRGEADSVAMFNRRQQGGPNPCVLHEGMAYVAPNDTNRVLAFHADSGLLRWERELKGRPAALLGVKDGKLIVAGDRLWSLDVETGGNYRGWEPLGGRDPEVQSFGRGLIAGDVVYWPRREEIVLVELSTWRLRREVDLAHQHGERGGNLVAAPGFLLVAQTNRLAAFGEYGVLRKKGDQVAAKEP